MPARFDAVTHRQIIRSKLRCDMAIVDADVQFLATHPEDAGWLKNNIEPRLWLKIQSLLESSQGEGAVCADREGALANSSTPEV